MSCHTQTDRDFHEDCIQVVQACYMMIFTYNNLLEYKSIDIFSAKPGERNSGPTGKNRPLLSPGVRTICHVPRTPLVERNHSGGLDCSCSAFNGTR